MKAVEKDIVLVKWHDAMGVSRLSNPYQPPSDMFVESLTIGVLLTEDEKGIGLAQHIEFPEDIGNMRMFYIPRIEGMQIEKIGSMLLQWPDEE